MLRAVIYARYSPGPNQTEQSIEGQVRECTKYAEQHDLRIVGSYIDRKISGKTDNRREFQRMIDDSEKHIFDVIILYHTDRFARNRYDSAIYKHKLKENGVELRYATTDIPKGPEGIILESIMEGWAEYYSAELSRKIKRGMRESALKCHSTGSGRCLGYITADDKSLVIEPNGAKAVQTVFDMYIKGKSHAEICKYLNDCGFRTAQGKLFNKNSVGHIIKNKRYIGVYTYDDITVEDGIPAIVSKDTFHLAQLEAERRKTAKRPKEPKAEYLLSGKAFCGHCQKQLVGVSGTGKSGNKWYYYYCQDSRAKRGCTKKPVKRDWLENEVVRRTISEVLQPEVIQHIAQKCYDIQVAYRQENSDVLFYELKLRDVRKAIKNTMHAIESGVKTKTLPARLQELENEEEAIEAELAIAKASDFVITVKQIEFLLTQFAERWECETEEEYRRRIIKCFVHKVFLFDDKLLIYYNVSRDGETREQSEAELLEAAFGSGFDKRTSGSTISLAVILVKLRRAFCVDTLMFELDREVYCMKKVLSVSIKTIIFFVGWAICVSVIPIPDTASAVIWRFWAELIPLLSVIAITLIFWLADQKKIRLHLTGKPVYNIILGGVTGTIWLGASVGILSILGVVQIEGKNQIAMLWLWLLAAFLNTVMQEMLVRGYLYQMIKSNGSIAAAIIVSTGLFTFAHGGAFEAGILPVLNVITMSLFMTAVLEYTGSLIAPIVIHFLWNGVGAIILGGVSLAEDYPHLFDMTIHGNPILSGGSCKIEGSIIVLFMNLAFLIGFVAAKKRKDRNR